MKQLYIVKQV